MLNILFVCHGNICRSPMAEYIFRDYVRRQGCADQFHIDSAATSTEELGNPIHPGTRKILRSLGIDPSAHRARQIGKADYDRYDYLIGMDDWNIRNITRIIGDDVDGKVYKFLDFSDHPRDIADPWYTGDFDETYRDIKEGCEAFYRYITEHKLID